MDSALLYTAEDRVDDLRMALRTARKIADSAVTDCRALLDQLVDSADA